MENKEIYITRSPEETEALGERLAKELRGTEVIAMFGGLGMGKTCIVRGLAKGLSISPESVSSPTFAIVNEYAGKYRMYHFDMYRISGWDDLYSTGFFDYLDNGVVVIEWSENIENALPDERIELRFEKGKGEDERVITLVRVSGGDTV